MPAQVLVLRSSARGHSPLVDLASLDALMSNANANEGGPGAVAEDRATRATAARSLVIGGFVGGAALAAALVAVSVMVSQAAAELLHI